MSGPKARSIFRTSTACFTYASLIFLQEYTLRSSAFCNESWFINTHTHTCTHRHTHAYTTARLSPRYCYFTFKYFIQNGCHNFLNIEFGRWILTFRNFRTFVKIRTLDHFPSILSKAVAFWTHKLSLRYREAKPMLISTMRRSSRFHSIVAMLLMTNNGTAIHTE